MILASFDFDKIIEKIQRSKSDFPAVLANIAQRHFKENFVKQGFVDIDVKPWKEVKRRMKKYGTESERTNPILQGKGSGKLKNAIQIIKSNWNEIKIATIGDEVNKYAAVHNEGLQSGRTGSWTSKTYHNTDSHKFAKRNKKEIQLVKTHEIKDAKGFTMPKRQFMGDSVALNEKLTKRIEQEIDNYFK